MTVRDQVCYEDVSPTFPIDLTWRGEKVRMLDAIVLNPPPRKRSRRHIFDRMTSDERSENQLLEELQEIEIILRQVQIAKDNQWLSANVDASVPQIDDLIPNEKHRQAKGVPLHRLLQGGAIALAIVCFLSLISWAVSDWPLIIVNPFVALLGLVGSPFLYLMGRAART